MVVVFPIETLLWIFDRVTDSESKDGSALKKQNQIKDSLVKIKLEWFNRLVKKYLIFCPLEGSNHPLLSTWTLPPNQARIY